MCHPVLTTHRSIIKAELSPEPTLASLSPHPLTGFPLPASPQDPEGGDHDGEQRDGGRVPRLLRHPPQPVQRERAVRHPAGEAAVQLDAGDQKGHGTTSGLPASATTATVTTVQTRLEQEDPLGVLMSMTMTMIGNNSLRVTSMRETISQSRVPGRVRRASRD